MKIERKTMQIFFGAGSLTDGIKKKLIFRKLS